jgi:hypothetical protein
VDLAGTISAVDREVWFMPAGTNRAVDLGSTTDAAANTLELSDAELQRITAGQLLVGTLSQGPVVISTPISPANAGLLLMYGTSVNDGESGSIVVEELAVYSGGAVTLDNAANDVSKVAIKTLTGNVSLTDANGFTVDRVGTVEGIDADNGVVTLRAITGNITIADSAASYDVEASGWIQITLQGNDATFTVASSAAVRSTGDNVNIQADEMALEGTITVPANMEVRLLTYGSGDALYLGGNPGQANTLELSDAELDRITAGRLELVAGSGPASINVWANQSQQRGHPAVVREPEHYPVIHGLGDRGASGPVRGLWPGLDGYERQ